jgi:plastocyanin
MKKILLALLCLSLLASFGCSKKPKQKLREKVQQEFIEVEDDREASVVTNADGTQTHTVIVKADGSFMPEQVEINKGDTVEWDFYEQTDSIARTESAGKCTDFSAYEAADPNEFTGPMTRLSSGIFVTGAFDGGLTVMQKGQTADMCDYKRNLAKTSDQYLCKAGELYETMDSTWENSELTGVYIRMNWNDVHKGPGEYDWTILDREIERAVKSGKKYSLSFRSGKNGQPNWLFDENVLGDEALTEYYFQDGGDELQAGQCGATMTLADITDEAYLKYYSEIIQASADHIKENGAWYQALAYFKPGGANMFTHEIRLPKNCEAGCVCNSDVWASAGYTPSGLYEFFSKQTAAIMAAYPEKDMSYQLIQDGFPQVDEVRGVTQTENVIKQGIAEHGDRFAVQHNGLKEDPVDGFNFNKSACPGGVGTGCPNPWVLKAGTAGAPTGFQALSLHSGVAELDELESTFKNLWNNSDAFFFEIYEEHLWKSAVEGPYFGKLNSNIGEWAERLHERRRADWEDAAGDPFPMSHSKTFDAVSSGDEFHYVNPSKCGDYGKYSGAILVK